MRLELTRTLATASPPRVAPHRRFLPTLALPSASPDPGLYPGEPET